jgi:multidrug efflux system outer membrane protein
MRHRRQIRALIAIGAGVLAAGCTLQKPYQASEPAAPAQWSRTTGATAALPVGLAAGEAWWMQLRDPAIDGLMVAALASSPTLEQAAARLDEARATLGISAAQRFPQVSFSASESRARTENNVGIGSNLGLDESSAQGGPSLSWELDLWGRVKQSRLEAAKNVDARDADAQAARLALAARIANGVLNLRSCRYSLKVRDDDIASRNTELALIRRRLNVGNVAPVDEASAISNLATAQTNRLSQMEQCGRDLNALVALSGEDIPDIERLLAQPLPASSSMPSPPPMQLALPAMVLENHPDVVAAERAVEAAWADIAVAKAERLPKVELDAALGGQWLSALGTAYQVFEWSFGPAISGPIFDGGAGASRVNAAKARYMEAEASLHSKLRDAVENVENALTQQASADARLVSSQQAQDAAQVALHANEARWQAGAISRFELETSRRQFELAEESTILATRDRCLAWVSLIDATGYGPSILAENNGTAPSGIPQS